MTSEEIEEILNMPAGEKIDILVAEKVMGWHLIPQEEDEDGIPWAQMWLDVGNRLMHNTFQPSTNLSTAWEIVKELQGRGFWFYCGSLSSYSYATFDNVKKVKTYTARARIDETPLAICRTALLLVMEDK